MPLKIHNAIVPGGPLRCDVLIGASRGRSAIGRGAAASWCSGAWLEVGLRGLRIPYLSNPPQDRGKKCTPRMARRVFLRCAKTILAMSEFHFSKA
ncbi:hypothetical protein CEXT_254081 [Caerostris extrusa]|uniref:Uncharacterized protein n=1 Tax=Caerostris extrusa TaxID=172846 RepID=A0AAV4SSB3_CAEEX|nr:hypothetical protein CEXT_254081 [Caerostris extrusa]